MMSYVVDALSIVNLTKVDLSGAKDFATGGERRMSHP